MVIQLFYNFCKRLPNLKAKVSHRNLQLQNSWVTKMLSSRYLFGSHTGSLKNLKKTAQKNPQTNPKQTINNNNKKQENKPHNNNNQVKNPKHHICYVSHFHAEKQLNKHQEYIAHLWKINYTVRKICVKKD